MVFRLGNAWFMMFILFDGKGYETHLSKSDDGCWIDVSWRAQEVQWGVENTRPS